MKIHIPHQPGIYKLQSKLFPEMIYVGATINLYIRYYNHLKSYSKRNNRNPLLYNHTLKYGYNDLEFKILKLCKEWQLMELEQYYISELKPYFNTFRFASFHDDKCNLAREIACQDISNDRNMMHPLFNEEHKLLTYLNNNL